MGAVPGWVVVGRTRRSLTVRFVFAAGSFTSSHATKLKSHGKRLFRAQERGPGAHSEDGGGGTSRPLAPFGRGSSFLRTPSLEPRQRQRRQSPQLAARFGIGVDPLVPGPARHSRCASSGAATRAGRAAARDRGDFVLQEGDAKYIDWWEQKMRQCQRPPTRELIKRLVSSNILGLDTNLRYGKLAQGGFAHELLDFKRKFPHEVILRRVGDSYESSGFDACVLAEYAGLNPTGGLTNSSVVPRVHCPVENLRQTLDALTRNGFSVCIVEEVKGPTIARNRKERFIAGHAHPGSPYVYGLAEADFDVDFPDPVSIIGISRSASGYCMISVVELMRSYAVEEQLTEEAVVAKLRAKPFQQLFLHKSLRNQSTETVRWGEFGEGGLLWAECRGQNVEWYESADPVSELLSKVRDMYDLESVEEFRRVVSPPGKRPRPLSIGTASQVGILPTDGVPSLPRVLFPPDMNNLCVAYLRDLLLNPPPYHVAADIQKAMRIIHNVHRSIPDFHCVSGAKLVKLIGAEEANHLEFARIKNMAEDVLLMENDPQMTVLLDLLFNPTWLATGLCMERDLLIEDCKFLVRRLDDVLASTGISCNAISRSKFVPDEFFQDMEGRWKGRVRRKHVETAFSDVDRAAASLCNAIEADFHPVVLRTRALAAPVGGGAGGASGEICYSFSNRAVWFRGKRFRPAMSSGGPGEEEIRALKEAKDTNGKKVGEEWFTTDHVENALEYYRSAVERASSAVLKVLKGVARELQSKMNTIIFITTVSIIAKTLFAHVAEAKRRKWVLPTLSEDRCQIAREQLSENLEESEDADSRAVDDRRSPSIHFQNLFPYWLDQSQDQIVLNTIHLESIFLLTGPNGGGKSSVLRSICAATLLSTCGLMVPASMAVVPRLDSIMLRMMNSDSPADCKSSFQMEMSELRTIVSEATSRSLVLVDELCKGTEANKGTCIVASVLEHLDHLRCLGVISTHLHGLLDMDLNVRKVINKAMGVKIVGGQPRPTWRLVDGVCRESLAFETARREGVPEKIVQRAEGFDRELRKTLHSDTAEVSTGQNLDHAVGSMPAEQARVSDEALAVGESPISAESNTRDEYHVFEGVPKTGLHSGEESFRPGEPLDDCRIAQSAVDGSSLYEGLSEGGSYVTREDDPKNDLENVLLRLCKRKVGELSGLEWNCKCYVGGPRQKPFPQITNHSCVYVLERPDGKLYVGQTDDMSTRIERHRSIPEFRDAPFLFVPLHNGSLAREVETYLINQLPKYGFSLVNKADQYHRYFGTAPLQGRSGEDDPPF